MKKNSFPSWGPFLEWHYENGQSPYSDYQVQVYANIKSHPPVFTTSYNGVSYFKIWVCTEYLFIAGEPKYVYAKLLGGKDNWAFEKFYA